MLNQNTYDQLADDFKYFDDPMDGHGLKKYKIFSVFQNYNF